ncbi:MAG: T9SS type A sorting domain-containing protein [Cytophagales bacterium]|nr:T9SS type A sorting domain-containing protein [Bernardetiaceae bacterium]MDW8209539.1 T9SS type A sorting domain-containing protein [Cytophagales bacterium]
MLGRYFVASCSAIGLIGVVQAQQPSLWRQLQIEYRKGFMPIVCPATTNHIRKNIPPPEAYLKWAEARRKGRTEETETARFIVQYEGFTPEAQAAFQKAIDIWSSLLTSPIPIRIRAVWAPNSRPNVLGSATSNGFFRSPLLPRFPVWYPVALAEKLLGVDLNGQEPDIVANFNSNNNNWYFGTDANPPRDKWDLTSVVLHEIAHGLGFVSSFQFESGRNLGRWGDSGFPFIYDTFVENSRGESLIDTTIFRNNSTALGRELTSGDVVFQGPQVRRANLGVPAPLYAPSPWQPGSSISHLDDRTYDGTSNQLMISAIGNGEAIHNPGPVALAIFDQLGWRNTRLLHTPHPNTDVTDRPYTLRANLVSDTTIDYNDYRLYIIYSLDRFATQQSVEMRRLSGNLYEGQIPPPNREATINYYLVAEHIRQNVRILWPAGVAPRITYSFIVAADNEPPVITHTPPAFLQVNTTELIIAANITDRLGIDTAYLEYRLNNEPLASAGMIQVQPNNFAALLRFSPGRITEGTVLSYRIIARDVSSRRNQSQSPANGFYQVRAEGLQPVRDSYANNFNTGGGEDFIGTDFRIETPSGFENGAIHSDHPYKDGTGINNESDYIYQMRFPIRIRQQNATMRFDEIVLVEPGEPGSVFGQITFWDYVIVEGSKDGGKTWQRLLDGYDSREHPAWLNAFNRGISANNPNSTTVGTPSLFRPRTINLLNTFQPGDEVVFRFRLFADESVHGWGWAIDNLQIQSDALGIEGYLASREDVRLYPNPAVDGKIMIRGKLLKRADKVRIIITDLLGREITTETLSMNALQLLHEVDIKHLSAGIYLVTLEIEGHCLTKPIVVP